MIFFPKYILLSNLSFTYLIIKLNVCPKIYSLIKTEIFVCFFFFPTTSLWQEKWDGGGEEIWWDKETKKQNKEIGKEEENLKLFNVDKKIA